MNIAHMHVLHTITWHIRTATLQTHYTHAQNMHTHNTNMCCTSTHMQTQYTNTLYIYMWIYTHAHITHTHHMHTLHTHPQRHTPTSIHRHSAHTTRRCFPRKRRPVLRVSDTSKAGTGYGTFAPHITSVLSSTCILQAP